MARFSTTVLIAVALLGAVGAARAGWAATKFSASIAIGVDFSDDKTGFISGGVNGQGPAVWRTEDSGSTWAQVPVQPAATFMSVAADVNKQAVVTGLLTVEHSDNGGNQFSKSGGFGAVGPAQSSAGVRNTAGQFGITGSTLFFNGVGFSTNGGKNFTAHSAWTGNSTMSARYGSFPSSNTWFVSAGSWPENNDVAPGVHQLTERIHIHPDQKLEVRMTPNHNTKAPQGYIAGIGKTTDGGKTWSTIFSKLNEFYFNDIDCWDESNCVAVGEADSGSAPGARIYTTNDGGSTWTRTMFLAGQANSIMGARYVSEKEVWACGGTMDSSFTGHFWHSLDGGKTWTVEDAPGMYGTTMAFTSSSHGFATTLDIDQQSGLAEYTA